MKMILEGSPADIRAAMIDGALIAKAVEAQIKGDAAVDNMKRMKEKVEGMRAGSLSDKEKKELEDLKKEATELRQHLSAHKSALSSAEAKVAQLKAQAANPIQLTPEQEAQLEAVFQAELGVMREPLIFSNSEGNKITPAMIVNRIFGFLANGDRMHAIKMIREVSGIRLQEGRSLIDDALRAFGCTVSHNGAPIPPRHEPIALPESMPSSVPNKYDFTKYTRDASGAVVPLQIEEKKT